MRRRSRLMKIVPKAHLNSSLVTITYYLLLKAGMARQKGLVQSRSGSVEPSPATLIRVAFNSSSHYYLVQNWHARRDSNPRPTA